jgi:hypothetical protein
MKLNLIVLRSSNMIKLVGFYRTIGMSLVEEQHANGPKHYAATLDHGVLEIYPAIETHKCMFGLSVESIELLRATWIRCGGVGKGDILIDPDGNVVYLSDNSD